MVWLEIKMLLKKQVKSQIKKPNSTYKTTRKGRNEESQVNRRKEIFKIRAEINAKETKETIGKINKAKSWFLKK